jgi:hypothetical protein
MVTRRDMGVSFAPAKRAAVWPRPSREPGRWPVPAARTAHRRLAAAGFAGLLEHLGNEALPLALAPVLRGAGAHAEIVVAAVGHGCSCKLGVSGRAKHADMPALARASRPTRHGGEAAPCRATPCADWLSTRPGAASCLAFRLCPRWRSGQRRPGGAAA